MADIIKHRGIVEKVDGMHITVRIVQTSACAACSAKGLCNASESKEKQIDVYEVNPSYQIGEEVVLCGTTSMGMRAVLLAFGVPLRWVCGPCCWRSECLSSSWYWHWVCR